MLLKEYIRLQLLQEIKFKRKRLDWYTTLFSRFIIEKIKFFILNPEKLIDIYFSDYTEMKKLIDEIKLPEFVVEFAPRHVVMLSPAGETDEEEIVIIIPLLYLDNFHDFKNLNQIIFDLKEVIRHELEHYAQYYQKTINFSSDAKDIETRSGIYLGWNLTLDGLRDYYYDKAELEAFVTGFYKRSKAENKPIRDVVNFYAQQFIEYLNAEIDNGKTDYTYKELEKFYCEWVQLILDLMKIRYPKARV